VGSRWKRIAVPAIGLFAVMAALAIVAGASIVLFPAENELAGAPPPAAGSSEVTQVTAGRGEFGASPGGQPEDVGGPPPAAPGTAPIASGPGSGSLSPFAPPVTRSPAGERPGSGGPNGPATGEDPDDESKSKGKGKAKGHDKPHNGKAKGHDKSHGKGNAKGHDKWHGSAASNDGKQKTKPAAVAFSSSGGTKHGHVAHSGTGKHGGGGDRPHSRPRR
jgi:hypothetical protein